MAKRKKRAVPADVWLDRATAAQVEKMKAALQIIPPVPSEPPAATGAEVPLHPIPVMDMALSEGQRSVVWPADAFNAETAYILELCPPRGAVPAWRLLKCKIERGVVVHVEAGVENLRDVALRDIEDHILRDA